MESKIVSIDLGERSYDVYIGKGLIYRLSELMPEDLERRSVYIITDTNVASYARAVSDALSDHAARVLTCTLPPGEQTKSFNQLEHICGWLLDNRVNRNAVIVAVGGGVIGDLAGFAAAIIGCYYAKLMREKAAGTNEFVGQEGEKIEITATLKYAPKYIESDFPKYLLTFEDDTGNVLVWFASKYISLNAGEKVKLTGTVKSHNIRGNIRQTVLTRCKIK